MLRDYSTVIIWEKWNEGDKVREKGNGREEIPTPTKIITIIYKIIFENISYTYLPCYILEVYVLIVPWCTVKAS